MKNRIVYAFILFIINYYILYQMIIELNSNPLLNTSHVAIAAFTWFAMFAIAIFSFGMSHEKMIVKQEREEPTLLTYRLYESQHVQEIVTYLKKVQPSQYWRVLDIDPRIPDRINIELLSRGENHAIIVGAMIGRAEEKAHRKYMDSIIHPHKG